MPEPSGRRRYTVQTLSAANEVGQLVRVRCSRCAVTRHYLPADLQKLAGDIPYWDLERVMRCERCRTRELEIRLVLPTAGERLNIRIRRLVEIRMVRKVIWSDD